MYFYLRLDFEGIQWGNNCNELNASYAADGYARIRGIGVSDKM
jgi:indolepyruvate decarboxylase